MLKNAHAMGWEDVTWLELTSTYSTNFAESISHTGEGLYVPAEFYPYTEKNDITNDWRELMTSSDIDLTAFSQGGYLAAKHFIKVIEQMNDEGVEINRDNLNEALRSLDPIDNDMIGTPFTFGDADAHDGNTCGWPIQLMSGTNEWEFADEGGDDWLCIPES